MLRTAALSAIFLFAPLAQAQKPVNLITPDLAGWEKNGNGIWTVLKDGTLIGQRPHPDGKTVLDGRWRSAQSWLVTKADYDQFDLHVEYWLPEGGNSGISIRDSSRGKTSYGPGAWKTPAHIGYEIQLLADAKTEKNPSGSLYDVVSAPAGLQVADDWNKIDIQVRKDKITIHLNSKLAVESPGVEGRPLTGPIGLQLHDAFSFVLFRNIRLLVK